MPVPDPQALIDEAQGVGVRLKAVGGKLFVSDPRHALDAKPELKNLLRVFRAQVAFALEHPPSDGFVIDRPWEREREAYAEM